MERQKECTVYCRGDQAMRINKIKFAICIITAFILGTILSGVVLLKSLDTAKYSKLDELMKTVDENYYMNANEEDMIDGACKGLIAGLDDPYSSYMTAEEYESFEASALGEYSGVGITFTEDFDGNYVIIEVAKDSPAEKGGLKAGDIIISADGKTYDDMELLSCDIRGEEGTDVKIGYVRDGKSKEVTLTRAKIVQHSVEHKMLDKDIGYIAISSFIDSTYDDFKKALTDIESKGADSLVLDLRNNGGGLVTSCVEIADEFLDKGTIVYVEDKAGNREDYYAEDGKTDLEVVVVVNENSASASEILAAALKDNGVRLIGETTFGKGIIQGTSKFKDGSALKLTIMQYFSPEGNAIHEKGVEPDYKVKDKESTDKDEQLEKAELLLN